MQKFLMMFVSHTNKDRGIQGRPLMTAQTDALRSNCYGKPVELGRVEPSSDEK